MNIFATYLRKIENLIKKNYKFLNIEADINIGGVIFETPPLEFNFDLSSNIALVLAKKTKQSPKKLAESIKKIIEENLDDFSTIEVAGPGFINFRFSPITLQKLILNILSFRCELTKRAGTRYTRGMTIRLNYRRVTSEQL